jgi:hypothetical protein
MILYLSSVKYVKFHGTELVVVNCARLYLPPGQNTFYGHTPFMVAVVTVTCTALFIT